MVLQVGRSTSTGKSSEARSANGLKWSRVSSQARIKIPCPAQPAPPPHFDHHPPLQGRRQRRLLQADPQTRVREPPPGMPPMRPLCPPRSAQRRHIRPGAKWIPGGLNPDEPQLLCRTRKKKDPDVDRVPTAFRQDPKEEIPEVGQAAIPEGSPSVFSVGSAFSMHPSRFFTPAPRRKSFSTPYICRDELPILITHFLALDLRFFVFVAR